LSELLLAGAASGGWLLLLLLSAGELLLDQAGGWFCGNGCGSGGRELLASEAALLLTRLAKMSPPCDGSDADRANLGGVL
jgi:hypothetical protein